ncbi:hypothetical protein [Methylibium petroleiphilum]
MLRPKRLAVQHQPHKLSERHARLRRLQLQPRDGLAVDPLFREFGVQFSQRATTPGALEPRRVVDPVGCAHAPPRRIETDDEFAERKVRDAVRRSLLMGARVMQVWANEWLP